MKKIAAVAGPIVVMIMLVPFLAALMVTAIASPAVGQELKTIACTGSMGFSPTITSKCRWLPVLAPVEPSPPRTCPIATASPSAILAAMLARCP